MVAFNFPKDKNVSLTEDYLVPLGLGDCTIVNGYLYADLHLTDEQIEAIEAEGFTRADTNWYNITPEPAREQRGALVKAFGAVPVTTELPVPGTLKVSFNEPLSREKLNAVKALGFTIRQP